MSKYEKLIEYIINEQEDKARELFHQIVVEKSRQIYESLIDEQDLEEVGGDEVDSMVDQVSGDEAGLEVDGLEDDGLEDDGLEDDGLEDDGLGDGEGDLESRVMDLEDELEDIQAKFAELMGNEAGEEDFSDADDEADDEGEDDDGEEDDDDGEEDADDEEEFAESRGSRSGRRMTETEWLREYVDKIGDPYSQQPAQGEGHEVGTGKKAKVDTKSIVAGKNDMGGTAKNIAQKTNEADPDGKPVPQPNNEYTKGKGNLPGANKFKNSPGGNAGKTVFKTKEGEYSTEHGKEGQTTDGSVSVDKKSVLKRIGK